MYRCSICWSSVEPTLLSEPPCRSQLLSLANDPGIDANPGAVRMIEAKLGGINAELDKALKDWHESYD